MFLVFPLCDGKRKATRVDFELNVEYSLLCKQNTNNIKKKKKKSMHIAEL